MLLALLLIALIHSPLADLADYEEVVANQQSKEIFNDLDNPIDNSFPANSLVPDPETDLDGNSDLSGNANDSISSLSDSSTAERDSQSIDNNDSESVDNDSSVRRILSNVKITAYCLRGRTRSGTYTTYGTAATDRRIMPQYTRFIIEGDPIIYTSLDTGSGVIGYHIDKWMDSCSAAIQWGVRYRNVELLD